MVGAISAAFLGAGTLAVAQTRSLGIDVSAWQGSISAANWATLKRATNQQVGGIFGDGRDFVVIRSSRGGTTGYYDQNDSANANGKNDYSQRYDDPYYIQNINRATSAGLLAGTYHFARPDIIASTLNAHGIANTGTDEANHMIQMGGPWMRPGYLPPVLDLESGSGIRTDDEMAQFCIDFSDRIYAVMGIRPGIYIGGDYSANVMQTASASLRTNVVSAFPTLWNARWPNQTNVPSIDVQNGNPKDSYSGFYGPWDDAPNPAQPWKLWQYASKGRVNAIGGGASDCDVDVAQGGVEFLKDLLVPALWVTNSSGQWTTLTNWNSGLTPVLPVTGTNQVAPVGTLTLPTPRLPDTNDTVIIDRGTFSPVITLSSGTHNIRKLYMRENLNITGGSLTVNYVPSWDSTTNGAQFSGPVALSNSASFSVHTLQVDISRTFTLAGGTLAFNKINLMPDLSLPAKILMAGDISFNSVAGATATITNGAGSGLSGKIDLGAGTRAFNVASGVNLIVSVPVSNGGVTMSGLGSMRFGSNNTYAGGTTISAGTLEGGVSGSIPGNVTNSAGTLKLDTASTLASSATLALAGSPGAGAVNLNFSGTQTVSALYFGTTRKAAGTYAVSGASHNNAAFSGSGILNVTTGPSSTSITGVSRTSGSSPSTYGDSLTFTATITGSSPGGTVQFKLDGVAAGGPVTLVGGSAPLVVNSLSVTGSPHQITAYYSGDVNNEASDNSASPISQPITAKPLTAVLTGTTTRAYNGTNFATLSAGNYSLPGIVSGDTVNLNNPASGTYDNRNAGSGKTVSVTGLAISGSSSTNYTLSSTSASGAIGTISQTNLTVTAAPNTKPYDGTTSAAATPAVTAGSIQAGDSAPAWTETYDTKNAGTNKTLTPAGTMGDANGGANYNVTLGINTNGAITALASSCSLASSVNPSGQGSNVTFTAAVIGVPPAADLPTGNVIFSANGTPFATNALVSGSINASTASLPSGTNAMTAEYLSDGNFLGSTGNVAQVVVSSVTCSQTNTVLSMADNHDGTFTLTFVGTPQADYYVLASSDLAAPMTSWAPMPGSTNTVTNITGLWQFTVTNTAPQKFYRGTAVVPCP